jgi:hypothetical protein
VVERRLGAQPGVLAVDANPVAQTATVEFDGRTDFGRGAAALGRGVRRDGAELGLPTAEVQVGELLLIRPGSKMPVDAEVLEGESAGGVFEPWA